jgi:quercetin dioxygenase-like cupin family protein
LPYNKIFNHKVYKIRTKYTKLKIVHSFYDSHPQTAAITVYNETITMRKYILASVLLAILSLSAKSQYSSGIVIEKLLQTDTTSIGQKIAYPNFNDPEITMSKITIHPGQSTGWHKHTFPVFAYVLKGILTVELEDHRLIKFKENSTYAEVMDIYHNGTNQEESDLIIIAIYLGGKGQKLSIPKEN